MCFVLITYNYGGMVKLMVYMVFMACMVSVMENEVTTRFTLAYEGLSIYLLIIMDGS